MTRRTVLWPIVALLGIIATAAVAWSASQLAGQRIGLSSEPLSVAGGLAPRNPSPPPPVDGAGEPEDARDGPAAARPSPRPAQSASPSNAAVPSPPSAAVPSHPPSATPIPPAIATPSPAPTPSPSPAPTPSPARPHDDSGGSQNSGGQRDD